VPSKLNGFSDSSGETSAPSSIDRTRVAQITNSIEQGTYIVRPRDIADRLLQLEQALRQLPDQAEPEATDG